MSVSHTNRIRALVLAGACAASLGIAACGGDDDTSSTTTTPAGATGASGSTTTGQVTANAIDALRSSLESQGIPSDQVDCVVDAVQENVSEEELSQAEQQLQNGQTPQVLQQAVQAAQSCVQ
jgi:NAD(P)H-dependent FMN reductase